MQPVILFEDKRWLVVDKPAGWLTIPGRAGGETRAETPVLSDWLKKHHGEVLTVHRLDRETSGVVLFARTAEEHRRCNTWFQNHEVRKRYDFLAVGNPGPPMLKIRRPIEGQACTTQVEVKERFPDGKGFLGRAFPLTGRRHQIRIHLAEEGHPLWGDPRYGGPRDPAGFQVPRVALHAAQLELPSGEKFEAPWPEDFRGWVEKAR